MSTIAARLARLEAEAAARPISPPAMTEQQWAALIAYARTANADSAAPLPPLPMPVKTVLDLNCPSEWIDALPLPDLIALHYTYERVREAFDQATSVARDRVARGQK